MALFRVPTAILTNQQQGELKLIQNHLNIHLFSNENDRNLNDLII
jgi:hypothetical protein